MNGDPLKLVKFMCVAKAHAIGRSESALTIHEGVWAFCPSGGDQKGHEWRPSDGLPLAEALRFTPQYAAAPAARATAAATHASKPTPPAAGPRGKARPR